MDESDEADVIPSGLGKKAISVIKRKIENHPEPCVRWKDRILESVQYLVGFIGMNSDMIKTTMKKNRVAFYAFHVYLLNMKRKSKLKFMSKGLKALDFLPKKLLRLNEVGIPVVNDKLHRLGKLSHFYYVIEQIMQPLAEVTFPGCLVKLQG